MTTDELRQLVEGIRFIEKMAANPVDKDAMARNSEDLRNMFTKSIVARKNLKAGTVLSDDDLSLKKPGSGIPVARLPEIIGRRLKRSVDADALISEDDLD
jgi:N-acetylneuraminate synthase